MSTFFENREQTKRNKVRVGISRKVKADMNNLESNFLAVTKFRIVITEQNQTFIDYVLYFLPNEDYPVGVMVSLPSVSNKNLRENDKSLLHVSDVISRKPSLASIVDMKHKDIIFRINGTLLITEGGIMSTSLCENLEMYDIQDIFDSSKRKECIVVLDCRRIINEKLYLELPLSTRQCYLTMSDELQRDCLEDNFPPETLDEEDMVNHMHPYVLLFYKQQLVNVARASLLNKILRGLKENNVNVWKTKFLEHTIPHGQRNTFRDSEASTNRISGELSYGRSIGGRRFVPLQHSFSMSYSISRDISTPLSPVKGSSPSTNSTDKQVEAATSSRYFLPKNKNIHDVFDNDVISSFTINNASIQSVLTSLRPALCVRILRSEQDASHNNTTFYVIWVLGILFLYSLCTGMVGLIYGIVSNVDVFTGVEWIVKRRFQDFYDFRQMLLRVRSGLANLEFPKKRLLSMVERFVLTQRVTGLEKFLRSVVRIVTTVNCNLLSTTKLRILLERFLDVNVRYEKIQYFQTELMGSAKFVCNSNDVNGMASVERRRRRKTRFLQRVTEKFLQVYVQQIIMQQETDQIINNYTEEFMNLSSPEQIEKLMKCNKIMNVGSGGNEESKNTGPSHALHFDFDSSSKLMSPLFNLKDFLDNLELLLYNATIDDCIDIVTVYGKYHNCKSCHHNSVSNLSSDDNGILLSPSTPSPVPPAPVSDCGALSSVNVTNGGRIISSLMSNCSISRTTEHNDTSNSISSSVEYHKHSSQSDNATHSRPPHAPTSSSSPGSTNSSHDAYHRTIPTVQLLNNMVTQASSVVVPPSTTKRNKNSFNNLTVLVSDDTLGRCDDKSSAMKQYLGGNVETEKGNLVSKDISGDDSCFGRSTSTELNSASGFCDESVVLEYEMIESYAHNAIRKQLEVEICSPPVCKQLRNYLQKYYAVEEQAMASKIASLSHKRQSYFGISSRFHSPSSWSDVVRSFRAIRTSNLPYDRIQAYLRTIKLITALHECEHSSSVSFGECQKPSRPSSPFPDNGNKCFSKSSNDQESRDVDDVSRELEWQGSSGVENKDVVAIGADDFLPILVYIVVRSRLVNILALSAELQLLCTENLRLSEAGYYLTALGAAIDHIKNYQFSK